MLFHLLLCHFNSLIKSKWSWDVLGWAIHVAGQVPLVDRREVVLHRLVVGDGLKRRGSIHTL